MLDDEEEVVEIEPSWWHYFWYLAFGWLLVPLAVAVWKQAGVTLRLQADRVQLETGIFRKRLLDLSITDINTVEITQTFFQRLVGIGDIKMATAGLEGYELAVRGLPQPRLIHEIVVARRRRLLMSAGAAAPESWPNRFAQPGHASDA